MLPTKFRFIWLGSFRGEDFSNIDQSETRIACGCHVFSSETHQPNKLKLSRKYLWKVLSKECTFCYDPLPNMALHRQFLFLIGQFLKIFSSETAWPK
jgi:hypothetical protein